MNDHQLEVSVVFIHTFCQCRDSIVKSPTTTFFAVSGIISSLQPKLCGIFGR